MNAEPELHSKRKWWLLLPLAMLLLLTAVLLGSRPSLSPQFSFLAPLKPVEHVRTADFNLGLGWSRVYSSELEFQRPYQEVKDAISRQFGADSLEYSHDGIVRSAVFRMKDGTTWHLASKSNSPTGGVSGATAFLHASSSKPPPGVRGWLLLVGSWLR